MTSTSAIGPALILLITGCASKYDGWEYVRIEESHPENCAYVIQEACTNLGATCYNWFKQRATVFGANTVVITSKESGFQSRGGGVLTPQLGVANSRAATTVTMLADYVNCSD